MKNLILLLFLLPWALAGIGKEIPKFVLHTSKGELEISRFKSYYFVSFDLSMPETVTLVAKEPIANATISPKNYRTSFAIDDRQIKIKLDKPGYILVRINETEKIFLFVEKPEKSPGKDDFIDIVIKYKVDSTGKTNETAKIQLALDEIAGTGKTLFFPHGTYKSGQLQLKSNRTIFFDRGALLKADTASVEFFRSKDEVATKRFISLYNVHNIRLFGYGAIDGCGRILRTKFGDEARMRLLMAIKSRNITIEGLQFRDPGSWNTQLLLCDDVTMKHIKLMNDPELSNTDGFDPDASHRILIQNCFAYCSDDNVAIKTTGNSGLLGNANDITVSGCVFLTRKSSLKVGTETRGNEMKNILFENNEVIESDRGIALYVSDGAVLSNITFLNNRFERNFPDQQRKAIHVVVNRRNPQSKLGEIKDVLIKDCSFDDNFPRRSMIRHDGDRIGIRMTIENLVVAGVKINSASEAAMETMQAEVKFR